jgi:hypothetical protein
MRLLTPISLLLLASSALGAQPASAPPPQVRQLGPVEAKAGELLKAVSTARALSDGRVLVNDVLGRRVLLFEKGLATYTVVADTTAATGNAYSSPFGGLLAYKGDTSLFLDPQALAMLVIEPQGKLGRVMSIPRPNDAMFMVAGNSGIPAFDGNGRLVYRGSPFNMQRMQFGARPPAPSGNATPAASQLVEIPDSMPLVRVELATRKLDTVAFLKTPRNRNSITTDSAGRMMVSSVINPMPVVDDWSVLSDGSIALVRGQDYHVDWVRPDGTRASSQRLPFEWRRLNDSMKVAYIDSARKAIEVARAQANQRVQPGQGPAPAGTGTGGGAPRMIVFQSGGPPGGAPGSDAPRPRDQNGNFNMQVPPPKLVEPNELPDYAPAFNPGAARADLDGNLWIRTSNVISGGSVYDVIDATGKMIDRVQLPAGRVIAGFGKDGMVYMGVREEGGVRLEQARRPASVTP